MFFPLLSDSTSALSVALSDIQRVLEVDFLSLQVRGIQEVLGW